MNGGLICKRLYNPCIHSEVHKIFKKLMYEVLRFFTWVLVQGNWKQEMRKWVEIEGSS